MSIQVSSERLLKFVPPEMEKDFYFEIYSQYSGAGEWENVVCLNQNLVEQMSFMFKSVLYFLETGTIIDEGLLGNEYEWRYLNQKYPGEHYQEEFLKFREDIKTVLFSRQMVFEENWLYARVTDEYKTDIYNSPIQSIW